MTTTTTSAGWNERRRGPPAGTVALGELIGASTIARDLTDRLRANQLAQELAAAAQRQRQAVQANDNVLQQLVIAEASDGRQAVDSARAEQPDVVLIDVSMPEMDGLTALPLISPER